MLNNLSIFWTNYVGFFELISLPLAVISLSVLLFYSFYFFIKLHFYKSKNSSFSEPISIIICAKNELDNLRKNLPIILAQNYFNFEVIVVNDQSSDESTFFLNELAKENKHLILNLICVLRVASQQETRYKKCKYGVYCLVHLNFIHGPWPFFLSLGHFLAKLFNNVS